MALALDWFGGAGRPEAWSAAFAAIALGSADRRQARNRLTLFSKLS
jgi:hypothetical protein